jgi:replicative DNA helicase
MFIYRDDYYNKETSEKPGIAELIVAKHRNGAVGGVDLAFMPHFTTFSDLARGEA